MRIVLSYTRIDQSVRALYRFYLQVVKDGFNEQVIDASEWV